ncbi:hypothetical protein ACHAWF_007728 [Thalassiosira exigua]
MKRVMRIIGTTTLSTACGQLEQSYQDYHCPEHKKDMECPFDTEMSIVGVTYAAKWYGAPGPLFCGPESEYLHVDVGHWDYTYNCHNPWADPPEYCTDYECQKAGKYHNSKPYFRGKRAADEDPDSCYPSIDFCKAPEIICQVKITRSSSGLRGEGVIFTSAMLFVILTRICLPL